MSIRVRMILWVLGGTLIIFLGILIVSYLTGRAAVIRVSQRSISNLVNSHAVRFEADFRQVAQVPKDLALILELHPDISEEEMYSLLRKTVSDNDLVYGSAIAFEPYVFHRDRYFYSPYYYRDNDRMSYVQLGNEQYHYFHWDWYLIPKLLKKPIWTEPYYDEGGGGTIMTTFSVPFFNPDASVRGIVTVDVDLEKLRKTTSEVKVGETGYAFVISQNGTIIVHPDSSYVMRESIFSIAEENNSPHLRKIGKQMISGESGIEVIQDYWRGGTYWFSFTSIQSSGWSFAVMLPEKEVLAAVLTLNKRLILLMVFGIFGLLITVIAISYSLTRPLKKLVGGAIQLATGRLDVKIEEKSRRSDEIGELTLAFNTMIDDLKKHIHDLTETTKAKERVERELSIAHDIQQSILPHTYPPFPDRKEIDLYAVTHPAREVGGDFFDYFFIDKDHLGLVVGDVSGKGVPAALFMAITRTLIKTAATDELSPSKTLEKVNAVICPENPYAMFVTVFYAVYNMINGHILFANAGHNLPFIKRADGTVEEVHRTRSTALGIMMDLQLEESSLHLNDNDILLLYTDGLTEAENSNQDMYNEERVQEFLQNKNDYENMKIFIDTLLRSVDAFVEGAQQFDDITLLALKKMI